MWLFGKKDKMSDEELVLKYYNTGSREFSGVLFDRYVKTVFGVCLFYFRDKDKARDAVMHIFEKLLSELRKTQVKNFKGWLSFVVRNHCISELRKEKGKRFVPETYLDFEVRAADPEEEQIIAGINDEEMLANLREVLPKLKDSQRLCIELFYLKGLSYQQISEQQGYSVPEVKSYLQNGKRNLKLLLEEKIKQKKNAA